MTDAAAAPQTTEPPSAPEAAGRDAGRRAALRAYAGCAALDLLAITVRLPVLAWVSKPLLAPLLVFVAVRAPRTRRALTAGLLCATAGDVALLLPGRTAFLVGMAAFLAMQLCYLAAFRALPGSTPRGLAGGYAVVWVGANALLAPRLGGLAVPVACYSAALLAMAASAARLGPRGLLGGALFAGSDLMIGVGAAGGDFHGRAFLIMASYAGAQALLITAATDRARRTAHPPAG